MIDPDSLLGTLDVTCLNSSAVENHTIDRNLIYPSMQEYQIGLSKLSSESNA